MLTILSSTGELMRLNPPGGFQNASYTVESIVPLIRCNESNDTVRMWTATAAYETVISAVSNFVNASRSTFYAQNLTFEAAWLSQTNSTRTDTYPGQIGYYAAPGNVTYINAFPYRTEYWIALANPPNGTRVETPQNIARLDDAKYYTCTMWNASVTTDVVFVNSAQTLRARAVQYLNYSEDTASIYAAENYMKFADLMYNFLHGFVVNTSYSNRWMTTWETSVDGTIFGTANDFSRVSLAYRVTDNVLDLYTQNRSFIELIEEFSLNASWGLMSMDDFK
jgi:hypothetical protein